MFIVKYYLYILGRKGGEIEIFRYSKKGNHFASIMRAFYFLKGVKYLKY